MENELKLQSYNNEMKEFLSKRDTDYWNHQRKITEAKGLLDIAQERKEKIYYRLQEFTQKVTNKLNDSTLNAERKHNRSLEFISEKFSQLDENIRRHQLSQQKQYQQQNENQSDTLIEKYLNYQKVKDKSKLTKQQWKKFHQENLQYKNEKMTENRRFMIQKNEEKLESLKEKIFQTREKLIKTSLQNGFKDIQTLHLVDIQKENVTFYQNFNNNHKESKKKQILDKHFLSSRQNTFFIDMRDKIKEKIPYIRMKHKSFHYENDNVNM